MPLVTTIEEVARQSLGQRLARMERMADDVAPRPCLSRRIRRSSAPFLSTDPDRWVLERQYLRNDAAEALAAFRGRRQEALDLFKKLSPTELQPWSS